MKLDQYLIKVDTVGALCRHPRLRLDARQQFLVSDGVSLAEILWCESGLNAGQT